MKCPVYATGKETPNQLGGDVLRECIKEGCAWWDKSKQWCCIHELGAIGDNLQYFLKEIRDKMLSPEFFKK